MGILTAIGGRRVYLDSNVFIYAMESYAEYEAELRALFGAIERVELPASTSQLTLAEVLVKPFQVGDRDKEVNYRRVVRTRAGLGVVPVGKAVLIEAARQRAATGLRLPDAIHVATARLDKCGAFLTNDRRIRSDESLEVIYLSDLVRT